MGRLHIHARTPHVDVALVHSIGRAHGPSYTSSWTRKYIFPSGYAPALSEVLPKVERSGLWLTDLEILRSHYAETLRIWRNRFLQASPARPPGLNERFVRMWDFYLASSEMAFRHHGLMVFQLQLSREPVEVPLTRDYIYAPKRTGTPESLSTGPDQHSKIPDRQSSVKHDGRYRYGDARRQIGVRPRSCIRREADGLRS